MEKQEVIFKATLTGKKDEIFTGHGDATKENVDGNAKKHWIRVGETRSLVRALRFYLGESAVAAEELTDDDKDFKKGKLK